MQAAFYQQLDQTLSQIKADGFWKAERLIGTPQGPAIHLADGRAVLNFCANNYLGLADDPRLVEAAADGLRSHGFGMASVRFICGTQDIHRELEGELARFLHTEDAILYSSCFDANGGLFETILGEEDAVISDSLNHASIIDGIRLSKAKRFRYANNDMADLERQLADAHSSRFRLIATDGVFSMDGVVADLAGIRELADRHDAMVMVDDSHAVGFMGASGRGSHEYRGVLGRIDVITGTLGKALGGASGGYTSGRKEIVDLLRQRSRPYLFSNTLAPVITATSIAVLDLLESAGELRRQLFENAKRFRDAMSQHGFTLVPGEHPIVPVMLGDAVMATRLADGLLAEGIYVIAFSYPVVPKDQARIRVQLSAAHEPEHVDRAVAAFAKVGKALGVIR